jgi:hypothetical protein
MIRYENFQCKNMHLFFVINFINIVIIRILYNAIIHKNEVSQSYYKDLLTRILNKLFHIFLRFAQFIMNI